MTCEFLYTRVHLQSYFFFTFDFILQKKPKSKEEKQEN